MKIGDKLISGTIIYNVPRLMFTANMNCALSSIINCGFRMITAEGVYYDQTGTGAIEQVLDSEYLILYDYDSISCPRDIQRMIEILENNPDIDAVVPIQMSRHNNNIICQDPSVDYTKPFSQIKLGHFGCTPIRSSVFKRIKKPWFWAKPNQNGEWKEGRVDADISFWNNCAENGIKVVSANDIIIGHMELFIKWPLGMDQVTVQQINDYSRRGMPKEVHFGIVPKPDTNPQFNLKL